jgi:hypothetical protein
MSVQGIKIEKRFIPPLHGLMKVFSGCLMQSSKAAELQMLIFMKIYYLPDNLSPTFISLACS